MIAKTVAEATSDADESQAVRNKMEEILRECFAKKSREPLDTKSIFDKVSGARQYVKPIDLSRALLDLMESRVVKWDDNFQLVPAEVNTTDR